MHGTAAFRCVTDYQPADGPGDKVFPSTCEGGRYATEERIDPGTGEVRRCVFLDSVQSQANRARTIPVRKRAMSTRSSGRCMHASEGDTGRRPSKRNAGSATLCADFKEPDHGHGLLDPPVTAVPRFTTAWM